MRFRSWTFREWVVLGFAAIGLSLLPWTIWLSQSLKPHHVTNRWDLAWSGFDTGLAVLFLATAFAALSSAAPVCPPFWCKANTAKMSPKSIPAAIRTMPPKTSMRRAPMAENAAVLFTEIVVSAIS